MTRLGSLFSGYLGLDMAVEATTGATTAWVCDNDPGACAVLAHRAPGVPNLGDITAVDWAAVEPVDIITGGSPCQDISHAGKRAGMTEGTRSNLWVSMRAAIAALRPSLVVWENVRGAYSACADSEMGRCPRCVGDDPTGPHAPYLRALGRVLGDLADLGFDAVWHGLRAADIGAPHGRFRVFVAAYPASDTRRVEHRDGGAAANTDNRAGHRERTCAEPRQGGEIALLPTPAVNDMGDRPWAREPGAWDAWVEEQRAKGINGNGHGKSLAIEAQRLLPTPTSMDSHASGGATPSDVTLTDATVRGVRDWGVYADAIARWEHVLGHPAPPPTMTSTKGKPQLSPAFSEWMMGLPDGWVTDVPGLTRNQQLKALGNGVVPAQAEVALRFLLTTMDVAA